MVDNSLEKQHVTCKMINSTSYLWYTINLAFDLVCHKLDSSALPFHCVLLGQCTLLY